jgi:NADH-quinone oxidoreductase subunit N
MTAPAIWIVFPLAASVGLFLLRSRQVLVLYLGAFLSLLLAFFAWVLPIGEVMTFGRLTVQIQPSLIILGRQFLIDQGDKPVVILTYGMGCFWFFGGLATRPRSFFVSVGLAMLAILVAAISVDPFLFSALLIEVAILISIPLMGIPGELAGQGIQRFLVFQTLGMPFILLAGWALGGTGANLGDPNLILGSIFLLGLGFAFLLAVFPFYTWIPLVSSEVNPYISGFIFSILPVMILFILLDFINGLAVIRESEMFFRALQFCGVLMIATGGMWAAFQRNIARLGGYAVILETGFFLLALGLKNQVGAQYFSMVLLPRIIELGLIALGLTMVKKHLPSLDSEELGSLFQRMPFAAVAIIAAFFSLAGIPLLAEFGLKIGLLSDFASHKDPSLIWVFIGILGFLIAIFRFLAIFIGTPTKAERFEEPRFAKGLILIGVISLFAIGLFPHFFLQGMTQIMGAFPMLAW